MRILSIVTATAIGLAASYGLANAQATNVAPKSGAAQTLGATTDPAMQSNRGMVSKKATAKSKKAKKATKKSSKKVSAAKRAPSATTGQAPARATTSSAPRSTTGSGGMQQPQQSR